jgi:cystathionine gamma-synthase
MGSQQDENRISQVTHFHTLAMLKPRLTIDNCQRFFINKIIEALASDILEKFGTSGEKVMLFPSNCVAQQCADFLLSQISHLRKQDVRMLDFVSDPEKETSDMKCVCPQVSAILFPSAHWNVAKTFWQHSGDGVSSRRAEYCHELFKEGLLVDRNTADEAQRLRKGPKRYRKSVTRDSEPTTSLDLLPLPNGSEEGKDSNLFIEERFGRNLGLKFATAAKLAIRKRIAGSLTADVPLADALALGKDEIRTRKVAGFSEDDIYLYSTGMSAIFNAHRSLMVARGQMKSISYG